MIQRTRKSKFDGFKSLTNQILSAQEHAQKIRLRDHPAHSSDLDKALARVCALQRQLVHHAKRNEFADECLKHELGWVVKISKALPLMFKSILTSLHSFYQTLEKHSEAEM